MFQNVQRSMATQVMLNVVGWSQTTKHYIPAVLAVFCATEAK